MTNPQQMATEDLCQSCKQPFVGRHRIATVKGTVETVSHVFPDCARRHGRARPEVEMDCIQYIRKSRLGMRLRDGYRLLMQPAGGC